MTQFEKDTQVLQNCLANMVKTLDNGDSILVTGGYSRHGYEDRLIESNCSNIVSKLLDLGYAYTSNHGYGCLDYRFTKKITL